MRRKSEFEAVLVAREQLLSRRNLLRGSATFAVLVGACTEIVPKGAQRLGVAGPSDAGLDAPLEDDPIPDASGDVAETKLTALGFVATPKHLLDEVRVPPGYTARVLHAVGDRLSANISDPVGDGTEVDYQLRIGDHHDGMSYFGLGDDVQTASARGLMVVNHENFTRIFLHPSGQTGPLRPLAEVEKEIAAHGVSIAEVTRQQGRLRIKLDSPYNRRITAETPPVPHEVARCCRRLTRPRPTSRAAPWPTARMDALPGAPI
jgi:uncharacterized protein